VYWISVENDDKRFTKIAKAVECSVPYDRVGGKYELAVKTPFLSK
jgi:hypothetical protein